jgi:uncharacterized protein YkwD
MANAAGAPGIPRRRGRGVRRIARGAVLLLAVVALAGPSTPARAAEDASHAYARRLFQLANHERVRHGLRPLRWASCADAYAWRWSAHLARRQVLYHQRIATMLNACRVRRAGENIADGRISAEAMVQLWMGSRRHRANILDPRFTHMGLAATRGSDGRWYAVQDFLGN